MLLGLDNLGFPFTFSESPGSVESTAMYLVSLDPVSTYPGWLMLKDTVELGREGLQFSSLLHNSAARVERDRSSETWASEMVVHLAIDCIKDLDCPRE